jgi:hypothetical protein
MCTQVLWCLSRLTRPRASDVTMRPDTTLTIFSTHTTQFIRDVSNSQFLFLVFHRTDNHVGLICSSRFIDS